jgi:hypothetical protein
MMISQPAFFELHRAGSIGTSSALGSKGKAKDAELAWTRRQDAIDAEAALDGL